jgi:hypothetical protein
MSRVFIIGGGAAGMMAGIFAARNGHKVHIYEKNEKLGKKLSLQERAGAILPMPQIWTLSLLRLSVIPSFYIAGFTAFPTNR